MKSCNCRRYLFMWSFGKVAKPKNTYELDLTLFNLVFSSDLNSKVFSCNWRLAAMTTVLLFGKLRRRSYLDLVDLVLVFAQMCQEDLELKNEVETKLIIYYICI